ncbi:unnamed protein product [Ectocarpus sp. 12 AP-2014]
MLDRHFPAPTLPWSPARSGHSSPQTGGIGFAAARGGGGAGSVPGATRRTEGRETVPRGRTPGDEGFRVSGAGARAGARARPDGASLKTCWQMGVVTSHI